MSTTKRVQTNSLKKSQAKFEAWLREQIQEYTEVLNLQAYQFQSLKFEEEETEAIFRIYNNYSYMSYGLGYSLTALHMFEKKEYDLLEYGVMHELVHIVLAELVHKAHSRSTTKEVDDSMERTVDHLAIVMKKYV